MKHKLVYGVGVFDGVMESTSIVYDSWHHMIERCYCLSRLEKYPSYSDCTVDPEWHLYSNFKKWFEVNYVDGYHLDKDVLVQGNKIYSSERCVFIPHRINNLLTDRARDRGEYPLGVSKESRRNKYKACISVLGKNKHLGFYDTPEEAHEAWRMAKKKYVSECANESFSKGEISERVRNALLHRNF
jgi:hypothetical protein